MFDCTIFRLCFQARKSLPTTQYVPTHTFLDLSHVTYVTEKSYEISLRAYVSIHISTHLLNVLYGGKAWLRLVKKCGDFTSLLEVFAP